MPVVSYRTFDGEVPKWSADLLPNQSAQFAKNCIFSDGKLRPMKDGFLLFTMVNNPVRGIYTEDGTLFYTWATETYAFKSPIIDDTYGRVYYLTPSEGIFRVTDKNAMAVNGPTPSNTFKVGVPKPTIAPTLKTVERSTLPDYPNASISAVAWWDYNGTKYSETVLTLTTVTALKSYSFTQPSLPSSPPSGVTPVLCVRFKFLDANNSSAVILDTTARSNTAARSLALPGGVEVSLAVASDGSAAINLLWAPVGASAYTYTYQNTWLEESAPAPPATISPTYIQDVVITPTSADFTGYKPFQAYLFYRTYGTGSTYIRTSVSGTGPYTDSSRTPSSVGVALQSTDWLPPVNGLQGIALMPGGWFVTFKDNILYKHAPYRPHAVPYTESFPTNIRGICVGRSGLVVTTADGSYLVPGAAPSESGYVNLGIQQPGIAQRSMQNLNGSVAYASNDGIALVEGSIGSMDASQKLFTREKWRELYSDILLDASMRFSCYDGQLLATSNTQPKGFILRLDENAGAYSRIEQQMDAAFLLPVQDALYYSVGANVYRFQGGNAMTYDWWSKDFIFTNEVSLGVGFVKSSASLQLQIYVDGVLKNTKTVSTGFFRIAPMRGRKWSFRLTGSATVEELKIAHTMTELRNVV